jgi:hypothetical protein
MNPEAIATNCLNDPEAELLWYIAKWCGLVPMSQKLPKRGQNDDS